MEQMLNYLQSIIDSTTQIQKWNPKGKLSLYLAGEYEYFEVKLLDMEFLLVKPYEQKNISKLKIQMKNIEEKTNYFVAVWITESTNYKRKKMLEERIPFIETEQQLYLPFIAIHKKKEKNTDIIINVCEKFSPSTQLIYLAILYCNEESFYMEDLAEKLGVSSMTITRGIKILEQLGIIKCTIGGETGRKKIFTKIEPRQYYQIGKEYLQTHIKREFYVNHIPDDVKVYKTGLTALAEQTMLGEPEQEIFAIHLSEEKKLKEVEITKEKAIEEHLPQIQVIKYDISTLTLNEYVDPITMILNLKEMDDRIEIAVAEFMEDTEWFEE